MIDIDSIPVEPVRQCPLFIAAQIAAGNSSVPENDNCRTECIRDKCMWYRNGIYLDIHGINTKVYDGRCGVLKG